MTARIVAELERELPLERLRIRDPRLCLDPAAPWVWQGATNLRIPRPQIPVERERNFRAPAKARVELRSHPLQQSLRAGIPQLVPGRVCTQPEVESDDGAVRAEERDIRHELPALEPTDPRVRAAKGAPELSLAETRRDPSRPTVLDDAAEGDATSSPASIGAPFLTRHRRRWSLRPMHWRSFEPLLTVAGSHGVRSDRPRCCHGLELRDHRSPGSAASPINRRSGFGRFPSAAGRSTRMRGVPWPVGGDFA